MAKVRVEIHEDGLRELLANNKYIRDAMFKVANAVKAAAESTAQDAQNGPGGSIDGYAEAGFKAVWQDRGRRPRIDIVSQADPGIALAAHFNSQRKNGVGHLRQALKDGTR